MLGPCCLVLPGILGQQAPPSQWCISENFRLANGPQSRNRSSSACPFGESAPKASWQTIQRNCLRASFWWQRLSADSGLHIWPVAFAIFAPFAAISADGTVVTWGLPNDGGDSMSLEKGKSANGFYENSWPEITHGARHPEVFWSLDSSASTASRPIVDRAEVGMSEKDLAISFYSVPFDFWFYVWQRLPSLLPFFASPLPGFLLRFPPCFASLLFCFSVVL